MLISRGIVQPVFMSRTSASLLRGVIDLSFVSYCFYYAVGSFDVRLREFEYKCYPYYPDEVKTFKYTHDYRYLMNLNLKVENFDFETKLPIKSLKKTDLNNQKLNKI
jgi:hypothetical protein